MPVCTLCRAEKAIPYCVTDIKRSYFFCPDCHLVFVNPENILPSHEERQRYTLHENNLDGTGYRKYLDTMWRPLLPKLHDMRSRTSCTLVGLDFGCGPTRAFEEYTREAEENARFNIKVHSYDPYFYPDQTRLDIQYDFIWCSEVFEHFNSPDESVAKVIQLLKPDGLLAVRTELYPPPAEFITWYYQRDPTHISFYNEHTMNWIAANWGLKFTCESSNVCFFEKPHDFV